MAPENLFAGAYLDRRAEARLNEDRLAEAQADPGTRYLAMRAGAALTHPPGNADPARIAFLNGQDPRVLAAVSPDRSVLLGWFREVRCVLVDLGTDAPEHEPQEQLAELRPLANELAPAEAGLVAYARALHL